MNKYKTTDQLAGITDINKTVYASSETEDLMNSLLISQKKLKGKKLRKLILSIKREAK